MEDAGAKPPQEDAEPRAPSLQRSSCLDRCRFLPGWPAALRLNLLGQYLNVTFTAVMLGAIFDAYLLIQGGSKSFVGGVESARGIATLLFALPIGWAGDRWPKTSVLRLNVLFGLASAALLVFGILTDAMVVIIVACVLYSIHNQFLFALLPPLFAEMTQPGEQRTQAMCHLQTAQSLGGASGPAMQLGLILAGGADRWEVPELHGILCLGVVFLALYAPVTLRAQRLGRDITGSNSPTRGAAQGSGNHAAWRWLIAGMFEAFSLTTAIGSGMTFKYWPLFFKDDFRFSPASVCLMQLGIWVSIAWGSQLAPTVARRIGRLPTALSLHVLGTFLLFVISLRPWGVAIEVPLVLVRNALMNSGGPLVQSLILELVPDEHRGKWSSIASLRRVTWSGSAFVGGLLSDAHDYRYAFFITACFHSASGFILLMSMVVRSLASCGGAPRRPARLLDAS